MKTKHTPDQKIYVPRLVDDGFNDHYTIHTDNFGTVLIGDPLDQEFVKLTPLVEAAPQMLEALNQIDSILLSATNETSTSVIRQCFAISAAAIAKAAGGEK